ncbi:MAG: ferritin-like domain-containing protein [Taibaiella sp.]|nr:ferritin-like domain-containing protein [Taibaiella sp.]
MPTKKTAVKPSSTARPKNTAKKPGTNTEPALRELFLDELKDIYWAEKHLTKALPKMKKGASSDTLSNAISEHLEITKVHVGRLEEVFSLLGEKAVAKKCDGMEGLTKEGESIIEETEDGSATRDAGIIISAQKVEHYEISAYGSLRQLALTLGEHEVADILEQTLNEEKEADQLLTHIAENDINYEAAAEYEEE